MPPDAPDEHLDRVDERPGRAFAGEVKCALSNMPADTSRVLSLRQFFKADYRGIACHTGSHLLVAATVSRGPARDSPRFLAVARQARCLGRVLGDAAYDAEHNHSLCRDRLGMRDPVPAEPPATPAGSGRGPGTGVR